MGGTAYIQEEFVGNRTSIFSSVARGERTALTGQGFDARPLLIRGETARLPAVDLPCDWQAAFFFARCLGQDSTAQDRTTVRKWCEGGRSPTTPCALESLDELL